MIPTWTYAKGKDGLYVNLFIGSTINVENVAGTDIEMVQKTDYPWSGKVAITVNPKVAKRFSVYVRVPNRTTSELYTATPAVNGLKSLAVNGKALTPKIEKGYAVITRDWKAGDKIELELPMKAQLIRPDEKVAADRGRVALRYGPMIYNVEAVDHQDINQPINPQAPLTAEWNNNLLDGVVVIKGSFADGSPLTAIPNFVRNNRGDAPPAGEASAGNAAIDYSGASASASGGATATSASGTTNSAVSSASSNTGNRRRQASSVVWMKGE